MQAHSNGVITNNPNQTSPQPFPLPYIVIAPLWADYESTGNISYRIVPETEQSSVGYIQHLLRATGQNLIDPTTVVVVTWDDMRCVNNGSVQVKSMLCGNGCWMLSESLFSLLQEYTFQCVIAGNDQLAVAVFLFTDANERFNPLSTSPIYPMRSPDVNNTCTNVVVGYSFSNSSYESVNTTGVNNFGDDVESIANGSNVNISGVWIYPIPLRLPRECVCVCVCVCVVCVCDICHSIAVVTQTPPTRRPPHVNLPNWAVSVWSIGEAIVSYLGGVGTVVLVACCVNRCKRRKEEKEKEKERDVEKAIDNGMLTKDLELLPGKLEAFY